MKVALISLGCPKNLIDSEKALGQLASEGVFFCSDIDDAEAVIINTCGFIEEAKQESVDVILRCLQRKAERRLRFVAVVGCLSARYREELLSELPDIDFIAGIANPLDIARLGNRLAKTESRGSRAKSYLSSRYPRLRLTPGHVAYLRIAEGCNNRCSYCAIPLIRGPLRSRAMTDIESEARQLVAGGAREIVLVAQDTTNFGADRGGRRRLATLARRLTTIDGLAWLRILYWHPAHTTDDLIETLAVNEKICAYVDIPLQHVNDRILRSMGRRVTHRSVERLLEKLRTRVPGVAVRTSFIVGYPGETTKEYDELVRFVKSVRFDHVGVFAYSAEEGTRAAALRAQVPEAVKKRRLDRLMRVQQEIVFEANRSLIGKVFRVVLDRPAPGRRDTWMSRSYREAPDVDSVIYTRVSGGRAGRFVEAEIMTADGYDLRARLRTRKEP